MFMDFSENVTGVPVKGLITAAGMGKRFGAVTRQTNKGLLIVGGKPLLTHCVTRFQQAGIRDIFVVAGYKAGLLRSRIAGALVAGSPVTGAPATVLLNPFYRVSGILGSFWIARPYVDHSPFVFTTSDHYFHPSILKDCLTVKRDVCVVVQKKRSYTAEDAKVTIEGEQILRLGKDIPIGKTDGEFGGMAYFSRVGSELFFKVLENRLEKGGLHGYVMDILNTMRDEYGMPIYYSTCAENSRIEIDSVYDLVVARKMAQTSPADRRAEEKFRRVADHEI